MRIMFLLLTTIFSLQTMDHIQETSNKTFASPDALNSFRMNYKKLHDKYNQHDSTLRDLVTLSSFLKKKCEDSKNFANESEKKMYERYADSLEYLYFGVKIIALEVHYKRNNISSAPIQGPRKKWFELLSDCMKADIDFYAKIAHYVNEEYKALQVHNEIQSIAK